MKAEYFDFTENTRYVKCGYGYNTFITTKNGDDKWVDYRTIAMPEHKYASCEIIVYNNGDYALRSYSTIVAYVTNNGFMSCAGTYSQTTRSHIGWFAKFINNKFGVDLFEFDVPISYHTFKYCAVNKCAFNIYTGHTVKL